MHEQVTAFEKDPSNPPEDSWDADDEESATRVYTFHVARRK